MLNRLLHQIMIAATLAAMSTGLALAQSYPTRPVTFIVPFPPGAVTDSMARVLQAAIEPTLGQPIIIENRSGAGGALGTALVARAQPDGYTLLVTVNAPVVQSPFIQANYPLDPKTALSGVAKVAETYLALAVQKQSPFNSVADIIRAAKEKPDQMTFGSAGVGSAHQIAGELLNKNAGIRITHVPFQGGGPAIQNLIGGHIDMSYGTLPAVLPFVESGELKLIAVAEAKRIAELPDVPAINETVPGVETATWLGMLAPAGTPKPIRERWYDLIANALKMPETAAKMKTLGVNVALEGPDAFDATIAKDLVFWKAAIEKIGLEKR
jgi:tripartite-type tricarboxylate transporter receptor subunit TctC